MQEVLDHIEQDIDELSGYALWSRSTDDLTTLIDSTAIQISRLTALQALALHELNGRERIHQDGASSATAWLRGRVRCSPGAAGAVARLGDLLDAREPIREAVLSGAVTAEQAAVIGKALDTLHNGLADLPAPVTVAEAGARAGIPAEAQRALLNLTGQLGPVELRRVGERILTRVAPDLAEAAERRWVERAEAEAQRRRGITLRPDGTGMWRLTGLLDAVDAAVVQAAIGHRPLPHQPLTDAGDQVDTATGVGGVGTTGRITANQGTGTTSTSSTTSTNPTGMNTACRDVNDRDADYRDVNDRDADDRDVNDRDVNDRDADYRDVNDRDADDRDVNDRDVNDRDADYRDVNDRDVNDRDADYRDVNDRDVNDRDADYRDVNDRDVNDRDADYRDVNDRDADYRDVNDRDADYRDVNDRDADYRDVNDRDADNRDVNDRDTDDRDADDPDASRPDASGRDRATVSATGADTHHDPDFHNSSGMDGTDEASALRLGGGRLDGVGHGDGPARDIRSAAQRRADALVEVCQRVLAQGELPAHGGVRPQITVTVGYETLTQQLGVGMLNTGDLISPSEVRRLACDAFILPAVMSSAGAVLDLGTRTRLFTGPIRQALILRDRGCAFPGCDRPPEWCEGHHIRHHADGGRTSLDNGCLLCTYHHHVVHREGWEIFIDPVDQLPSFRPPAYLDIERKPLRNLIHRHIT